MLRNILKLFFVVLGTLAVYGAVNNSDWLAKQAKESPGSLIARAAPYGAGGITGIAIGLVAFRGHA
jgi:hypothetical protein